MVETLRTEGVGGITKPFRAKHLPFFLRPSIDINPQLIDYIPFQTDEL